LITLRNSFKSVAHDKFNTVRTVLKCMRGPAKGGSFVSDRDKEPLVKGPFITLTADIEKALLSMSNSRKEKERTMGLIPKTGVYTTKPVIERLKAASTLTEDLAGGRIFVIGSILGRHDLLELMLETIEDVGPLAKNDKIVFLGNFIGCGDDANNRSVIHTLFHYEQERQQQCFILRGKNEEAFIMSDQNLFTSNFGKHLVEDYMERHTYSHSKMTSSKMDVKEFLIARDWLSLLPYYMETKRYYLMHGGVDATKPWEEQILKGLLYRGMLFEKQEPDYKKVVVHAQPVFEQGPKVLAKKNRISLPPSSKNSLCCAVLRDYEEKNLKEGLDPNLIEVLKVELNEGKKVTEIATVDVDQLPEETGVDE